MNEPEKDKATVVAHWVASAFLCAAVPFVLVLVGMGVWKAIGESPVPFFCVVGTIAYCAAVACLKRRMDGWF
jgi:hypothetical protein